MNTQIPAQPSTSFWQKIRGLFLAHPDSIGEGYLEHQRKALWFAWVLAGTAVAALVHAVFPALCQHTARNRIEQLHVQLQSRSAPRSIDR